MKTIFCSLLLTIGTAAASLVERTSCTSYDDNFDNIKTVPALPLLAPVGVQNGINYQGFSVAAPPPNTGGLTPHSSPNVAAASINTDEVELGTISLTVFGNLVATAPTKSFDLKSFYFGCLLYDRASVVITTQGCTIAVTGFFTNGQQAPEVTFAYAPVTLENAPMNLAVLPTTYKGLKNVTIGVAGAAVASPLTVLELDDVVHCNYS